LGRVLSKRMSLRQFENGYWYQLDLVAFGRELGLPAAHRMRKNELESAITTYLSTGSLPKTVQAKPTKKGPKDLDVGLALDLPIANYTSNRATKGFIVSSAQRKRPGIKAKSGVWYRLNRWREARVAKGRVTYGDLVDQFIALNTLERFERVPHVRYVYFLADFLAREKDASRADALAAWKMLKRLDAPKTYASWKRAAERKPRPRARTTKR
jgi:hypothetical protein